MAKNEVALVQTGDNVPAHAAAAGRGNEEVGVDNLAIPRLKLLQKMNDEVDENHPNHVPGAKAGMFMNSLTKELYEDGVYVINVKFTESYSVWKKRELGGGFAGVRDTLAEAQAIIDEQSNPAEYSISHSHDHLLLIKDATTGEVSKPIIMGFASSKLSVSKRWNSVISMKGGDRFSGLWKLKPVSQTNRANQPFFNLEPEFVGWCMDEDYKAAEAVYESFQK